MSRWASGPGLIEEGDLHVMRATADFFPSTIQGSHRGRREEIRRLKLLVLACGLWIPEPSSFGRCGCCGHGEVSSWFSTYYQAYRAHVGHRSYSSRF